ncbi:MAG: RNA methyltransferase [Acidobacteriota bacterium]
MIIDKITSRQNPLVKRLRAIREGRERHLIFIEGVRLVEEAIRAKLYIEAVAYTERLLSIDRGTQLYSQLLHLPCRGALVTESVMALISDVETPQGVVAIAHLPYANLTDAIRKQTPLVVIAHQLQDPGNLGTLIRSAEAVGADSLITTPGTVDPFNLKALRAAMGSAFRLPTIINARLSAIAELSRNAGLILVAADVKGECRYSDFNWTVPVALLLGQEAHGLDETAATIVEKRLTIPMIDTVESLNVAAAATVLLYEAARQRQFNF